MHHISVQRSGIHYSSDHSCVSLDHLRSLQKCFSAYYYFALCHFETCATSGPWALAQAWSFGPRWGLILRAWMAARACGHRTGFHSKLYHSGSPKRFLAGKEVVEVCSIRTELLDSGNRMFELKLSRTKKTTLYILQWSQKKMWILRKSKNRQHSFTKYHKVFPNNYSRTQKTNDISSILFKAQTCTLFEICINSKARTIKS